MTTKIYEFKPLFSTKLADMLALLNVAIIIFTLIIGVGIVFYQMSVYCLLIPIGLIIVKSIHKNSGNAWITDGYKLVKIDGVNRFIFLDDFAISFSEIDYAKVCFEEKGSLNKSFSFHERISLGDFANMKICLSLKNGDSLTIPVQYKSCLRNIITILEKYIVVKADKKVKDVQGSTISPLFLIVFVAIIGWIFSNNYYK